MALALVFRLVKSVVSRRRSGQKKTRPVQKRLVATCLAANIRRLYQVLRPLPSLRGAPGSDRLDERRCHHLADMASYGAGCWRLYLYAYRVLFIVVMPALRSSA
jgi:hypothetical protein